MADADTRDKRQSVLAVGLPIRPLPNPGSLAQTDFEHLVMLYVGVQGSGPGQPTWLRYAGTRHMGQGQRLGRSW